jgi:hypothetical protein
LDQHFSEQVSVSSRERITLLVLGIIRSQSASPARIAEALSELGLSNATTESIERRTRRIENDEQLTATLCFHPFAKERLAFGRPKELLLICDPTTQDDRVVMVTASVWYRGRALPLAWLVWPANVPLEGDGFWERIEQLLDTVATILPCDVPVTWLADRAFGTPAFTDLVTSRGWCYIVRAQGQTKCEDVNGRCCQLSQLVNLQGKRAKLKGRVFKKRGWRDASVVVYWGYGHQKPLCLVSNLPPRWSLIHLYRRRYPIEALFRDYKSHGWHWEQGQVTDLEHLQRLLCGMALATWIALFCGTQVASEYLSQAPTGRRRTVPWVGKRSLFRLGLQRLLQLLSGSCQVTICWQLCHFSAPNWQKQIYFHHARAFVFAFK